MSKYSRHQSVISRESDASIDEDNWLNKLHKSLQKDAVQSKREDSFLFDQISSIMNKKSKYPSVNAAVEEMKERSGLTAYLSKKSNDSIPRKIASDSNNSIDKKIDIEPIVIKKSPQIKKTLENYIRDTKGNLPVPAIIEKIKSIHKKDVSESSDWQDDNLIRLVSKMNLKAKSSNPDTYQNYSNLGSHEDTNDSEIDPSNTDAFYALNPTKF